MLNSTFTDHTIQSSHIEYDRETEQESALEHMFMDV